MIALHYIKDLDKDLIEELGDIFEILKYKSCCTKRKCCTTSESVDCYLVTDNELDGLIANTVNVVLAIIKDEVSMKYKNGGETEEFMAGHYAGSVLARAKIRRCFNSKTKGADV